MKVLVLYSTTEGQAKKIAERISSIIEGDGHEAHAHCMASAQPSPPIGGFDAVIAAASVHQGYHQESATAFIGACVAELAEKRTAFVSVSLSAVLDGGTEEAQSYVDGFVEKTGWTPDRTLLLGGAIRLSTYDHFERQVITYILMKKGVADVTIADYECTDWDALEDFVRSFLADMRGSDVSAEDRLGA